MFESEDAKATFLSEHKDYAARLDALEAVAGKKGAFAGGAKLEERLSALESSFESLNERVMTLEENASKNADS